jgi:hypothetical protein
MELLSASALKGEATAEAASKALRPVLVQIDTANSDRTVFAHR